ncbi:hypothetical protein L1987_15808 [Smallanthus sonchifolius]|uniref:Uncharacterized protein n=1 Tax=Smallanthus sonchifolius TaxID=185202 RepID=A0ACB9J846_9ASTR|nr:hypothetical protein L1987_15808 [Smallanthus sonchifolius]
MVCSFNRTPVFSPASALDGSGGLSFLSRRRFSVAHGAHHPSLNRSLRSRSYDVFSVAQTEAQVVKIEDKKKGHRQHL